MALLCATVVGAAGPAPRTFRSVFHPLVTPERPYAAADVHAALDGREIKVGQVLTPADDQMLLLVMDLSGDLTQADPAKTAAAESIGSLPANDYVAVLRAQDGLRVLTDPTPDRGAAATAVRDMPVSGRPGLLEVLESVQQLADSIARKSRVRVGVIYVTDSDVTLYREDFTNPVINSSDPHDLSRRFPEQLIQEKISKLDTLLATSQTPMHIVHLVERTDALNMAYQNGLRRLADASGGAFSVCKTTADIPGAIAGAFRTVTGEYSAYLELPEHAPAKALVRLWAKNDSGNEAGLVYRSRVSLKEKR